MLRIGRALLKSLNDEMVYFVWYTGSGAGERLDVIGNIASYSSINTSNCMAAYYRKVKERLFGEEHIIREIMRIEHEASILAAAEDREVKFEDGHFIMEISKQSDTGVRFYNKMVDGLISYQEYQTSLGIISIDKITVEDSGMVTPINLDLYTTVEVADGLEGNTKRSVKTEWYTYEELLRKYPQVMHVLENDYVVVRNYEQAEERLKIWINSKEQLKTFDIESYSTNWGPFSENRITGVFLGFGQGWSTYFPFRQENFKYNLPIEFLRRIFDAINNQPPAPEVLLIAHNSKFEIQGFYQEYTECIRCDIDTLPLSILVDPVIKKKSHDLKTLTSKVDGNFYLTLDMIFIGPIQFNVLDEDTVLLYGCPDATSPAKIYPWLMEQLPKDEGYVLGLEMGLPPIKAMNEFYGIRMDMELLTEKRSDSEYNHDKLSEIFKKIHHTSKNINSNEVLKEIIYDKLRCKVEVWTNKGQPSTSKAAIARIVKTGARQIQDGDSIPESIKDKHGKELVAGKDLASNKYPSMVIYQKYKLIEKELGAFNRLDKKSDHGYFKFYINQCGAGSNRQTSDAHQFSTAMKECALADSPYHGLVSCDWSQVELRILAAMAGEEKLLEQMNKPGVDIHRAVWNIISKKPIWDISEEERKNIKSLNFGVVYMMSEYGLAASKYGVSYTKQQLLTERQNITDFYNNLPKIAEFQNRVVKGLLDNGYVKTAFNYYRYFKEILDPLIDPKLKKRLIRSANNTPVQGTGAQLLKIVETLLYEYIKKKGWDKVKDYDGVLLPMVRMILPIHDEILLSYDKEIPKEEICKMFKECMELDVKGFPPLFASPAFISNWADGKNAAYEIDTEFRDHIVEEYEKGNYLLTGKDYLQVLTDYRNGVIQRYMDGLISKYKTVDEVADHVRDDVLTHTLIETMIPDSSDRKKFTHRERIHEATRRYIKAIEEDGRLSAVLSSEVYEEEDKVLEAPSLDDWLDEHRVFDQNGALISDDDEEEEEYDERFLFNDDESYKPVEYQPYVYAMSELFVDISDLDIRGNGEKLHRGIMELTDPNEHYTLWYINGNKQVKTKYRIGYHPERLNELFSEAIGGNNNGV